MPVELGSDPRRWLPLLLLVLMAGAALGQAAPTPLVDEATGLIVDEHWELVKAQCTVCHSARLVTQQRASRQTWLNLIKWMQNTQGLWQFDTTTENSILDYLAKNYAPSASYRRAPLDPALMPPPEKDPGEKTLRPEQRRRTYQDQHSFYDRTKPDSYSDRVGHTRIPQPRRYRHNRNL